MKSFSNLSHPDLRIILAGLKLLKIVILQNSCVFAGFMTRVAKESIIEDLQDQRKNNEPIDQLLLAIDAELPNAPEEKL